MDAEVQRIVFTSFDEPRRQDAPSTTARRRYTVQNP
jgi:hypothetical protein